MKGVKGVFRSLTEKPWEHHVVPVGGATAVPPQRIALWFFLGVVGVLFTLFMVAYVVRMELADWRPMPETPWLWINTAVLFVSSVILQWTRMQLAGGNVDRVKLGLLLGGLCSLGFIIGQLYVWQLMHSEGYLLYNNPANAFFYVLTGIHGLHLLGGLWVWGRATLELWCSPTPSLEKIRLRVELCTVYWHFLLLVWLVLFGLLSYT